MSSPAATIPTSIAVDKSFHELEKQRELITTCTQLWKDLSDHFSTLEKTLQIKSDSLSSKRQSLEDSTRRTLDSLRRREVSIDGSVDFAIGRVDEVRAAALQALSAAVSDLGEGEGDGNLVKMVRLLCAKMDSEGFLDFVVGKRKEVEILRAEMPVVLADCVDPAKFVLDAISRVFPVDRREVRSPNEVGWVCVVVLESLVHVLADPELGIARPLVTGCVKERAAEMAKEWKERVELQGGIESVKPPDAHAFLQHVVTFGIVRKEDKELYKSLVISFAWRKQMPKLAISLGLDDLMEDIIEELISKGHQLDAINFAYEAGLQEKFPPVPLVKSFLKDSKKATAISTVEDTNNPGQAASNNNRKEQSVIRAAIKCIQDHNLEADFPLENLQKRLEQLEKVKQDKKRPSVGGPATKRTRASNGGPMPPAKAGRLTNNAYVSSFPAASAFVRSPSAHTEYAAAPPYAYDRPVGHGVYGSRSPPSIREPYAYPSAEVAPAAIGAPYHSPPMSYPAYGSYNNALGGYNNGMAPGYQQAYYR